MTKKVEQDYLELAEEVLAYLKLKGSKSEKMRFNSFTADPTFKNVWRDKDDDTDETFEIYGTCLNLTPHKGLGGFVVFLSDDRSFSHFLHSSEGLDIPQISKEVADASRNAQLEAEYREASKYNVSVIPLTCPTKDLKKDVKSFVIKKNPPLGVPEVSILPMKVSSKVELDQETLDVARACVEVMKVLMKEEKFHREEFPEFYCEVDFNTSWSVRDDEGVSGTRWGVSLTLQSVSEDVRLKVLLDPKGDYEVLAYDEGILEVDPLNSLKTRMQRA